jgi:formate-dependent nitrite reductase membrane component NrfD
MSNPLTTPQFVLPLRPPIELYNVAHERSFSILFVNYSWALGLAGGLVLLWAINAWRGKYDSVEHRFTLPLAVALIIGGFVNILAEVEEPGRLIYGYIYGWSNWDTAIIKYGIILLPLFLALCWWLSFQAMPRVSLATEIGRLGSPWRQLADFFSLWSRFYNLFSSPFLSRVVLVAMIFLGLFGPLYSAIFLMNEHGVPIWNSPAEALLFLITGIGVAAMAMLVLVPLLGWFSSGRWLPAEPHHRWTAAICLGLWGLVWYGWMWWLGRFGTLEELRAANLFMGPYAGEIFWNWTFAGLIVPLLALVTPLGRSVYAQTVALIGGAWGSYAARVGIVFAGEAVNRSGAGYLTFHLGFNALWYSVVSALLFAGFLAALLAATPHPSATFDKV